jgi:hypothetical protein
MSGGRRKQALLGDAMEAVIAAVYLDAGFEAARAMILRLWGAGSRGRSRCPRCQDRAAGMGAGPRLAPPPMSETARTGPDHAPPSPSSCGGGGCARCPMVRSLRNGLRSGRGAPALSGPCRAFRSAEGAGERRGGGGSARGCRRRGRQDRSGGPDRVSLPAVVVRAARDPEGLVRPLPGSRPCP